MLGHENRNDGICTKPALQLESTTWRLVITGNNNRMAFSCAWHFSNSVMAFCMAASCMSSSDSSRAAIRVSTSRSKAVTAMSMPTQIRMLMLMFLAFCQRQGLWGFPASQPPGAQALARRKCAARA